MHRGIREFIRWVDDHRETDLVKVSAPASTASLASLERELGGPLPTDLRFVLGRHNGAELPTVTLLPAGIEPGTIGACVREYAEKVEADFLDPELLLPFARTEEGSLLAFDRSAGPVSDTWPIVDYYEDTGEHRLVYRTFDGFCRRYVSDWTCDDFGAEFTLDVYLRQGERHVAVEPDVATAHVTVAHARKRAGMADEALDSYLTAARCVPPLPWCDWEALKIAALIGRDKDAFEAASRLAARGTDESWALRETNPGWVAEVIGPIAKRAKFKRRWVRLLSLLTEQADDEDTPTVRAIRDSVQAGTPLPRLRSPREEPVVPPNEDIEAFWGAVWNAYYQGALRDEDLLLEPTLAPIRELGRVGDVVRMRRDF